MIFCSRDTAATSSSPNSSATESFVLFYFVFSGQAPNKGFLLQSDVLSFPDTVPLLVTHLEPTHFKCKATGFIISPTYDGSHANKPIINWKYYLVTVNFIDHSTDPRNLAAHRALGYWCFHPGSCAWLGAVVCGCFWPASWDNVTWHLFSLVRQCHMA